MITWRLVIEYDGREFSGFQRQKTDRTVQATLEDALTLFFGGERIIVHGSGRTDAGVHALGQVVSFRANTPRIPDRLRLGLNTMLPPDVSVIEADHAPDDFHARISAIGKRYRYVILARPDRSPFHNGRAWYLRRRINWDAVDEALTLFQGTHDFAAFRAASCTIRRTVRDVDRAQRTQVGQEQHLEFEGNGFLRYMVRILVGTAVEVGTGHRTLDDVRQALQTGERKLAGRTAPPDGLYLVNVHYRDGYMRPTRQAVEEED
jgi:tRNA pseudouridine38-40 synthase